MTRYCAFLLLFLSITAYSQGSKAVKNIDVYPIRVDHKWGYVKFYPSFIDTLIQPRYDYIGDINLPWNTAQRVLSTVSSFRIFEIDEKVGLLDANLQEVLPNNYNRIRPLSPLYFAVEKDSLFVLIDRDENELFNGEKYNDIKSDWSDERLEFIFVKKNNKWGLRKVDGTLLINCKYYDLKSMPTKGYFLAKTEASHSKWTLINATGEKILPDYYSDVKIVDQDMIAAKLVSRPFFGLYIKAKGKYVKNKQKYTFIEKINDSLLVVYPYVASINKPDTIELWNLDEEKKIKSYQIIKLGGRYQFKPVPWFYPLDDKYAIIEKQTRDKQSLKKYLIDLSAEIISPPFDTIFCTAKEGVYFTGRKFKDGDADFYWKWGLIAPGKDSICTTRCIYDEILDFEDDIAIIHNKVDGYGALAIRGNRGDFLECLYLNIFKSDENTLQVQTKNDLTVIYKLTDDLEFMEDALYEKTMVFSGNVKSQMREALPNSIPRIGYNPANTFKSEWPSFSFTYMGDELCLYSKKRLVEYIEVKEKAASIVEISPSVFAYYHQTKKIETAFTTDYYRGAVAQVSVYNLKKNILNSKVEMISFRPFRKGYKYTAFLTPNGKMGLMDRNGDQLMANGKPVRYLFIGDFFANRARVCIGDRLFMDRDDKLEIPSQFRICTKRDFTNDFYVERDSIVSFDREGNKGLYALRKSGDPKWGYIDENGQLILEPDADFVLDFNTISRTAKILKKNNRDNMVKPSADIGLIDTMGNIILDVDYNDVREYVDFHQVAVDSTPTFYFTKSGHQLFVNRTKLRPFYEGLALFSDSEKKWGYLDTLGQIAITPQYLMARPFSDGVAMVVDSTGYCSFIDKNGTILFRSTFTQKQWRGIGDFHEGKVWFKRSNGWVWGCYDKQGEEIILPKFYYQITLTGKEDQADPYHLPMDFSNDVAAVLTFNTAGKRFASIIDSTGNKVMDDQIYKSISRFDAHGLASYSLKDRPGIGVMNALGEKLTETVYSKINAFENGYAKVLGTNKKWGLIDIKGKQLLPCVYNAMGVVSEGLVAVKTSDRAEWFFVTLQNRVSIKGPFQSVNPFKNGITLVKHKDTKRIINKSGQSVFLKMGEPIFFSDGILGIVKEKKRKKKDEIYFYADESGSNIFSRYFSEIAPFQLGIAQVRRTKPENSIQKREFLGAINKRGVMVVPPKFRNLHLQPDGNIIINPQLFFGITNKEGELLLDPIYDRIQYFSKDNILRVEQGEKIGYVFLKDDGVEWIWDLQH